MRRIRVEVRMDPELGARLDALVAQLRERHRGRPVSREGLIREVLHLALAHPRLLRQLGA